MTQKLIDAYELEREMYRRCIDTDIEIEKGRAKWDSGLWIRYKVFEDAITVAPMVEAEPVKHGRWIAYKRHVAGEPYIAFDESGEPFIQRPQIEVTRYKCPFCGEIEDIATPYCCECGAKMEGDQNE